MLGVDERGMCHCLFVRRHAGIFVVALIQHRLHRGSRRETEEPQEKCTCPKPVDFPMHPFFKCPTAGSLINAIDGQGATKRDWREAGVSTQVNVIQYRCQTLAVLDW